MDGIDDSAYHAFVKNSPQNNGQILAITHSFSKTPFGEVLIASTTQGICRLTFIDTERTAIEQLQQTFPHAALSEATNDMHQRAQAAINGNWTAVNAIPLHLQGTDFQMKVWEALRTIPLGQLSTYGEIAKNIGLPKACRAVGTAIGANPIAMVIPCHRVVQASGALGKYHWGSPRKAAMLAWEAAQMNDENYSK